MESLDIKLNSTKMNTCRAAGLPICEPEKSSSGADNLHFKKIKPPQSAKTVLCDCIKKLEELRLEEAMEEGEEYSFEDPATFDEEPQFEQIQAELLKQKKRVDLIDERLSLNIKECPEGDACKDMNVELNKHNVHPDILELQRHNHQLSEQLNQLQLSCKAADWSLRHLRNSLCRDLNTGGVMQRRLNKLNSLKLEMEHEHGLCRQRYRHLQEEKYEWTDCANFVSKRQEDAMKDLENYVLKIDYMDYMNEAVDLLTQAKIEAIKAHDYLAENMAQLNQLVDPSVSPDVHLRGHFGTEVAAFLQRNKHLANKTN